jgi:hypothetical protein
MLQERKSKREIDNSERAIDQQQETNEAIMKEQ